MTHAPAAPTREMDKMYRLTRHVYDATRKPYLLGRDRLLTSIHSTLNPGDCVLEVGSGTARNLIKLAHSRPDLYLFGIDASNVMLQTAQANLAKHGLQDQVTLRLALAESFNRQSLFSLARPFDAIYFSYSLSMIPQWQAALAQAAQNLAPGGSIHIVDFWDQAQFPRLFAGSLKRWLAFFGVHHRPELLDHLKSLPGSLTLTSHKRRYAYLAKYTPTPGGTLRREG